MSGHKFEKSYSSHAEFYQDVYSHAVKEVRPAGSRGITMMFVEQEAGDWSDAPSPDLVVGEALHYPTSSSIDLGAGSFRTSPPEKGFICVPPETATKIVVDGAHSVRITAIPYGSLRDLAGGSTSLPADGDFGSVHAKMHQDAEVINLLDRLWLEARRGGVLGSLWVDGAVLQLVAHLLRLRDGRIAQSRGGLAPWQLKRVTEYIAANLQRDVTLPELAAICEISPAHFSRAYKQSTGHSPVQALINMRMERARVLLVDPTWPVTDVAALCGYDSPSAFARLFRRTVGVTPMEWRRQMRT